MKKMIVLFALLSVVKAEESSIMGSATVVRDAISNRGIGALTQMSLSKVDSNTLFTRMQ